MPQGMVTNFYQYCLLMICLTLQHFLGVNLLSVTESAINTFSKVCLFFTCVCYFHLLCFMEINYLSIVLWLECVIIKQINTTKKAVVWHTCAYRLAAIGQLLTQLRKHCILINILVCAYSK